MISVILLLLYLGSGLMIKHKASGTLSDDQKHMRRDAVISL
jgi:hypothetical protein